MDKYILETEVAVLLSAVSRRGAKEALIEAFTEVEKVLQAKGIEMLAWDVHSVDDLEWSHRDPHAEACPSCGRDPHARACPSCGCGDQARVKVQESGG